VGGDASSLKKAQPDTSRGTGGDWTRYGLTLCVLDLEADAVIQMGILKYRYKHLEMPDWEASLVHFSPVQGIVLYFFEGLGWCIDVSYPLQFDVTPTHLG